MMELEVRFEKIVNRKDCPDAELEQNIKQGLGNPGDYIQAIIIKAAQVIIGEVEPIDYFGVQIVASDNCKLGFAFKVFKEKRIFPSITVGFTGNLEEFSKTIIHEFLHYVGWDEYAVEKKTQNIYSTVEKEG